MENTTPEPTRADIDQMTGPVVLEFVLIGAAIATR